MKKGRNMTKSKVGKPKQYTTKHLETLLLKFIEDNPSRRITYIDLERETRVGRNTWARNMKDKIEVLNRPMTINDASQGQILPLPNISELVNNNYGNKQKLIEALLQVNSSVQKLYVQAKNVPHLEQEIENLTSQLKKLDEKSKNDKETIRSLKEQVDHFSQAYRDVAVMSSYPDSNMKNVLEFKKDDKKNENKIMADLIKQFEMFGPKL
jgi:flagellar biosynthesis chaperone FliJ